ncbi:Alpha/Beta hydrolase protein [Pestalotiopsis sp. NC0098]|nr:Alpha/Beta hydrolase protein [Pestalotiopsis sp. NC0098]
MSPSPSAQGSRSPSGTTEPAMANPIHPDFVDRLDQDFVNFYNSTLGRTTPDNSAPLEEVRKQRAQFHSRKAAGGKLAQQQRAAFVQDVKLQAPDGHLFTVRLYRPDPRTSPYGAGPYPVHVNFHGGGFTFGDLNSDAKICMQIRTRVGIMVADVDYRLRPEHAMGRGHDDCWAAVQYMRDHGAQLNARQDSISIGGISAGGQIAAVMQQLARDAALPLKFAFLGVPVTASHAHYEQASDSEFPSFVENEFAPCLNWARIMFYRENAQMKEAHAALAEEEAALPAFYSAPLSGDLAGVCPTFVGTASADPLRDEGEAYGQKLVAAGVKTTIRRYQGVPHPFMHMPLKKAEMYTHDLCDALRTAHGVAFVKPSLSVFPRKKMFQTSRQQQRRAAPPPPPAAGGIRRNMARSWSWTPGKLALASRLKQ